MLSHWWLRLKSRRNRMWCGLLDCIASSNYETVWTDHYTRPASSAPGPFTIYVEVVSRLHAYRFGRNLGLRVVVKITEVTVTEHLLTGQMRMIQQAWQYVGLNRRDLFALLSHDLPWLKELPAGRPGENRPSDRRPPKYIE